MNIDYILKCFCGSSLKSHFQGSQNSNSLNICTMDPDDLKAGPETKERDTHESDVDTDDDVPEEEDALTSVQVLQRKEEVLALKESGNSSFRNGDYEEAIKQYKFAGALCKHKDLYPERAVLLSNRAASELKLSLYKAAIHSASRAIKYNPEFPKAYLRYVAHQHFCIIPPNH